AGRLPRHPRQRGRPGPHLDAAAGLRRAAEGGAAGVRQEHPAGTRRPAPRARTGGRLPHLLRVQLCAGGVRGSDRRQPHPVRRHDHALLLVDLQEAFFANRVLAAARPRLLAAARPRLLAAVHRLAEGARRAGVPIFLISTEHSRDRSTWTLSMLDDDQGFLFHGDAGTATVAELDTTGMTRLEKTRDSAWLGTDLPLRLRNLGVDRVMIAGASAHACIA